MSQFVEHYDIESNTRSLLYDDPNCSKDKAYLAIIITILPLWAIATVLIVFILLSLHRKIRSTRIYDNCSKVEAHFAYYIEIRTGDTSSTYNRRRTTVTIDMFDDNQSTLAKIAIPGHVIFGRKDMPIGPIEDEKYFELRVTRFWLYRASRLKRVSTIRLIHNCLEPEARIMVYGVEIRANEPDRYKQFFPVMSYISAYGSASKPNACFDLEPAGSISAMGGSQSDLSSISEHLSWVDYTVLVYLVMALVFYGTSFELFKISNSAKDTLAGFYKGALVGLVSYLIALSTGVALKFIVKHNYSLRIGIGIWAGLYYSSCIGLLVISTSLWIYTTVLSYKHMCPAYYNVWVLSISIAFAEVVVLEILNWLISWLIQLLNPKNVEQYVLPEDIGGSSQEPPSKGHSYPQRFLSSKQQHWQSGGLPVQLVVSTGGSAGQNLYGQPILVNPALMGQSGSFKAAAAQANSPTYQAIAYESPTHQQTQTSHQTQASTSTSTQATGKGLRKIGSNESTGSTYYQQLMKNKGGVKSISQYGELLRQKKASVKHQQK